MNADALASKTFELHRKAWSEQKNWDEHIETALSIVRDHVDLINESGVVRSNYAALLLEANRNHDALALLREDLPETAEAYQNMAIAIAKSAYEIESIRKYNLEAQELPTNEFGIVAYIDWHGF